jgi:hypothetical protein
MQLSKEFRLFGGDRAMVKLELSHRELGNHDTVTHEPDSLPYGYLRVSFIGELAPKGVRFGTNAGSYGQIVDHMPKALRRVWSRWHLNNMRAGCVHLGKGSAIGDVCEVSGYKYGYAWLVDPLTLDGALDILRVMGADHSVTVVAHDNVAVWVFDSMTEALRHMHDTLPYSWDHAMRHEGWQVANVIGVPELASV